MGQLSRQELARELAADAGASWAGRIKAIPEPEWAARIPAAGQLRADAGRQSQHGHINAAMEVYIRDRTLAYQTFKAASDAAWAAYHHAMQEANDEYDRAVITAGAALDRAMVHNDPGLAV